MYKFFEIVIDFQGDEKCGSINSDTFKEAFNLCTFYESSQKYSKLFIKLIFDLHLTFI